MVAAISGFFCIAFGAFGAHALKAALSDDAMITWQTAVQYHMFQTLALLVVALLPMTKPPGSGSRLDLRKQNFRYMAAYLFILGLILFCGSLYLLALTELRWLGAITPLGGVSFLAGWVLLFFYAWPIKHEGKRE